ncbi:MAG: valine--tRNA ligase [Deltaproteobacteria bacterium]|nr:valine--tRNA ligase [Deltaproteobacteria bacterium]
MSATPVLSKVYEPHQVEEKWYQFWLDKGYFRADENGSDKTYTIVIPPPNVTGSLHMGHALNNTLQDILVRYKRMCGFNTLWMPGMDHAGIATQNVVEKQLSSEGISREDLGREKFVERVWQWREKYGGIIIQQLKRLGASCDWERERFTMDAGLSRAVREVFVSLYEEGLIYKGDYIINWCPRCNTALSDLEVEHDEVKGKLYFIKYPVVDSKKLVVVATTRPETMLGDTALAVNPNDKRYQKLIGKRAILPILNREIPIIADEYVDMKFGTGALKITPAHDPNDFEIGNTHGLERIKVIDNDGVMNGQAGPYEGLDRFRCRDKILKDLKKIELVKKVEDYNHQIGHCYRCKTVVEPFISKQWFVKVKPLAERALEAVEKGETTIVPKNWEKTYFEWMRNIRDWCISRQIWWGHQIPAWTCKECGKVTVAREDPDMCVYCQSKNIEQEEDVLDTWFSSALWPFSTSGWPDKTKELSLFYPTSVLVTAFDILFFWVARMMMMGLKFMGEVPFKEVYIHAIVRDVEGKKMSKSKGNVIDPLTVMDQYGTDAFRFTLAALAVQGRDVRLAEERIKGYRNFANKIWNASRFALMNLEGYNANNIDSSIVSSSLVDKWIVSRLHRLIREVEETLRDYKFNELAHLIYHFIWHEFCDWYLELIKPVLNQRDDNESKLATQHTMIRVLANSLQLLHPIMPFITEEIWQKLPTTQESIMISPYPECDLKKIDGDAEKKMDLIIDVVNNIRNVRWEMNVPPSQMVEVILFSKNHESLEILQDCKGYIESLGKADSVIISDSVTKPKSAATAVAQDVEIFLPLKGVIDFAEEEKRLKKEIGKTMKDLDSVNKKLSNEDFLAKAPEDIIEKEKVKAGDLKEKQEKLEKGLNRIRKLVSEVK